MVQGFARLIVANPAVMAATLEDTTVLMLQASYAPRGTLFV